MSTLVKQGKYLCFDEILALLEEYWKAGCQCGDGIEQCDLCQRTGNALLTNGKLD